MMTNKQAQSGSKASANSLHRWRTWGSRPENFLLSPWGNYRPPTALQGWRRRLLRKMLAQGRGPKAGGSGGFSHRFNPSRTSRALCRIEGKAFVIFRYQCWQYGKQRNRHHQSGLESIPVVETGPKQFERLHQRWRRQKEAPRSLDLVSLSSEEWWQSIRPVQVRGCH